MANTTNTKVTSQFDGVTFDSDDVDDAISEASRIVSQYELMAYGSVDVASDSKVIDYSGRFVNRGIESGAKLWKINDSHRKIIVDGSPVSVTVDSVSDNELSYTDENVSFDQGDHYMVENMARRTRAETYKACSLLLSRIKSSGKVADGVEVVQVGEIEVEFGDIEAVADAIDSNHFEKKFASIVGAY